MRSYPHILFDLEIGHTVEVEDDLTAKDVDPGSTFAFMECNIIRVLTNLSRARTHDTRRTLEHVSLHRV